MSDTAAKRNILVVIDKNPLVHLKGHSSQHFDINRMQYIYSAINKCASKEEFKIACKNSGWDCCDLFDDSIYIRGEHQIFISQDGDVFIDGKPFTVRDQICADKDKSKPSPERKEKIMSIEHSSLTNEQVQNMTNHINARSQRQSYSVGKRYDDGSIEKLYECIPNIHDAWALAQYAMEKNRKNENDGIIIMYPGYNDAELKAVNNFTAFAEDLADKYAVDEEDRGISKPKRSLSPDEKKRIKAFEDWINENTENGVTSTPENLTRNILRIIKRLVGDC